MGVDKHGENQPKEGARGKGRPRSRFSDRREQVRQNMRLYRARRAAELEALARSLEALASAVASRDLEQTFLAAAATSGLWATGTIKDNVIKNRSRRRPAERESPQTA